MTRASDWAIDVVVSNIHMLTARHTRSIKILMLYGYQSFSRDDIGHLAQVAGVDRDRFLAYMLEASDQDADGLYWYHPDTLRWAIREAS